MARRTQFMRNPVASLAKSKALPFVLVGAGLYLLYKMPAPAAPVNGLSGLGFSLSKAIKHAVAPIQKVTENKFVKVPLAIATGGTSAMMAKANQQTVKAVTSAENRFIAPKPAPAPAPAAPAAADQQIIYQDSNGNPITKAQYDALMAQYGAAQQAQVTPAYNSPPIYNQAAAQGNPTSYTDPNSVYGGGGGGSTADAYGPSAQAPDQSASPGIDPAAPAPESKVHPLVVAGAVIGVPVLMSFLGSK